MIEQVGNMMGYNIYDARECLVVISGAEPEVVAGLAAFALLMTICASLAFSAWERRKRYMADQGLEQKFEDWRRKRC